MKKFIIFDLLVIGVFVVNCGSKTNASTPNPNDTTTTPKGLIFSTGFEESDWRKQWDDYDGNPDNTNTLVENPGPFNKPGNHVMRLRVPAGTGGADLIKVLPSTHKKLYAQWYQYWEPGYDFTARNHGSGLFAGDRNLLGRSGFRPTGADRASISIEPDNQNGGRPFLYTYYRGMYMDCRDPDGSCWGDHFPCSFRPSYCTNAAHSAPPGPMPPEMKTGKWYRIQLMVDLGDPSPSNGGANGSVNFWIDGVPYGPWEKLWFRTTGDLKLTILDLRTYFHAAHSVEGVYFDDVAVSTEPFK